MKQSDDHAAFYEKYQFTMTLEKKHPQFGDVMHFEGLEAEYVSRLERQLAHLEKYIAHQNEKMDWLRDREFARYEKPKP